MNDHDDFQFRPLTEGLGFHQKNEAKSAPETMVQKSTPATSVPSRLKFQTDLPDIELSTPMLPRKDHSKDRNSENSKPASQPRKQIPTTNTVDEILKTLNDKKHFDFADKKKAPATPVVETYKASHFDISAGTLDAMLVTAATLLSLIVMLVITKVDLFANLSNPDSQYMIYISMAMMVCGIAWIYLVGNRIFLGYTPGEWVFDQRVGQPKQLGSASYALKIAARSTAVIFTGFILFPLFSMLFNSDLLGKVFGAELLKKA